MPNLDPLDLPPSQEPSAPDSIVDLHGIIRLVLDKSWLIVSCVVLAVIAAAVYVQRAPRVYEARHHGSSGTTGRKSRQSRAGGVRRYARAWMF